MSEETVPNIPLKKPFPEDRAIKLALAREKALEVRRRNKETKMRAELERMETARKPKEEPTELSEATVPPPVPEPEVFDFEEPQAEPVREKVVKKVKKKRKEVVIVEQSSDDSDDFESHPNVIFVKRNKRKKKEIEPPPPPSPPPQTVRDPEPTPTRLPPSLTAEQMQVQEYYHNMFSGVGIGRRRF